MNGLFGELPDDVSFAQFQTEWNAMAETHVLPTVREVTEKRKVQLRKRLRNPAWLMNWPIVVEKIPEIPFCLGRNDRRWRVTFDFVIRNDDNHIKILEWWDRSHTETHGTVEDAQRSAASAGAMNIKL